MNFSNLPESFFSKGDEGKKNGGLIRWCKGPGTFFPYRQYFCRCNWHEAHPLGTDEGEKGEGEL